MYDLFYVNYSSIYPPQYSCLENPTDSGAWWATVHGVTKSRTQLGGYAQHSKWLLKGVAGERLANLSE